METNYACLRFIIKRGFCWGFYHKGSAVSIKCLLIRTLIWVLVRTHESSTEEPLSSKLFTAMGQVTLQTMHGHLLVPLNLPSLKKAFDHYADLQSAINKLVSGNSDSYKHLQYELATLRRKLDIIHHLALTKKKDSLF